ncbi:MAG: Tim44 domain-containing protein [Burkholderiaceae bacterium]|nr:Tim44 domain-containing protein [Burkholderiaceae bacterium]
MKNLLFALSVAVAAVSLGLAPTDADAKRLGGGKAAGMQRQAPPANAAPTSPAATPNAPAAAPAAQPGAAAAAGTAAAPGKRSWLGPVAGLAAGLGLAALFSHLGMGEGLANFVMLALLAVVAFIAIRFVMSRIGGNARRAGGPQLAGAGAPLGGSGPGWQQPSAEPAPLQRSALATPAAAGAAAGPVGPTAVTTLPGGMAAADFERLAKMVFIRMQAANDAANVDDLRKFTTPELFASLRLDLQERGAARQQTDVVHIEAQVVEVAQDKGLDIVTVRFHGLIRETPESGAEAFNELWHLVRPADGQGDWAIAGITPVQ